MVKFDNCWDDLLKDEFEKPYYQQLRVFLKYEYTHYTVYPNMYDLFSAFKATSFEAVKVVILGQDPYHGEGQAHGMAFSVKPGVPAPPSLQNIYKELQNSLGCKIPDHGYLMKWAEQGVFLLNTVLTVRRGQPQSHQGKGWETFTDHVISLLNQREDPIVFLLWGSPAQRKAKLVTAPQHKLLTASHPSPFSAHNGFFGCDHFRKANAFLETAGKAPVDFQIEDYCSFSTGKI